ncbi:MAG: ATP-dependent helicase, partial [Candidatus Riflebacteria bacterium]|nr:ATP-dependent helicase [Candidatus Riflebacteria bacterium]
FRESAGRALLLPKAGFGRRTPLWLSRQRAKELLAAVGSFDDFPMVLEAWRTCLNDEMELDRLRLLLAELAQGQIRVSEVETTRPTPLAGDVLWKRTNRLMYEDDTPAVGRSRLDRSLISEVALSPGSRPPVPAEQAEILRTKLQRTCPGYAPADAAELQQLVTDRVFVGADEWLELLDAVERDHRLDRTAVLAGVAARVVALPVTGAARPVVCSVEWVGPIVEALGIDPAPALLGAALDGTPATEEALQAAAELDRRRPASERVADLPGLLSEWLRFQGPIAVATVAGLLGLPEEQLLDAVQVGVDEQSLVVGTLTGGERLEVSDTRNLQRLLRAARARARPAFEALGPEKLPLFLALHQGLGGQPLPPGGAEDSVQHALEPLLGFPAPAGCWETHILPARLDPYRTEWLDSVLTHTDLLWFGCGNQRIAFSLLPDLELFAALEDRPGPDALVSADALFPASRGRFSFVELATHSGLDSAALSARLWDLCWRGIVSNDGFDAVRHGLASRFRAALPAGLPSPGSTRSRRIGLGRWRSTRPMTGGWYRLPPPAEPEDPLEGEELSRDRARVLLARWGVVFRELAARELPGLRWAPLFRSLQLLELAGEAVAGRFFEGVGGVQFATPEAVEVLTRGLDEDRVFWVNGVDPASPCGLGIERLKLPKRSESTHLVFHGSRLIVTSEGRGRRLEIQAEPTDPDLTHYLRFLQVLVTREASPVRSIEVETINGQPAGVSRYRPALESLFHVSADSRSLRLTKRY